MSDAQHNLMFQISQIGGVRILDGHIIDVLEAQALSFNRSYIDIYSASWGPDDNGKTVDGPGKYASRDPVECSLRIATC